MHVNEKNDSVPNGHAIVAEVDTETHPSGGGRSLEPSRGCLEVDAKVRNTSEIAKYHWRREEIAGVRERAKAVLLTRWGNRWFREHGWAFLLMRWAWPGQGWQGGA